MFRSLLYDHPQRSSSVLSALPFLRLLASSFAYSVCGRMPSMCMCVRCTCLWVVCKVPLFQSKCNNMHGAKVRIVTFFRLRNLQKLSAD
jgi:hypothetical protein